MQCGDGKSEANANAERSMQESWAARGLVQTVKDSMHEHHNRAQQKLEKTTNRHLAEGWTVKHTAPLDSTANNRRLDISVMENNEIKRWEQSIAEHSVDMFKWIELD